MSAATCTRIKIETLVVDRRYQRPVEEKRVTRIINEFDANLLGTMELSRRADGTHAVIDGQHRYEALKRLGRKVTPALVHEGLTVAQEADLFAKTNMGRKPLTPIQRFKAQVFSGDPMAVALQSIVTKAGFKVDYAETATELGVIRSIVALEKAYRAHGGEHVSQVLSTIRDLWFGERAATDASFIRGMSTFMSVYGANFNGEHAERLRRTPALAIIRRAQELTVSDSRASIASLIADDLRKLSGLRGAKAAGVKVVTEDEKHERHLAAV